MSECEVLKGHSERCRAFYSLSARNLCDQELDLESPLAAAQSELKMGNHLCAQLTDKNNDLESELAAAKAEIANYGECINGHKSPRWVCGNCESDVFQKALSETKRLREALENYASCADDCSCCPQVAGEPTKDGYRVLIHDRWYSTRPIDERPKCDCGFKAALDGGKA